MDDSTKPNDRTKVVSFLVGITLCDQHANNDTTMIRCDHMASNKMSFERFVKVLVSKYYFPSIRLSAVHCHVKTVSCAELRYLIKRTMNIPRMRVFLDSMKKDVSPNSMKKSILKYVFLFCVVLSFLIISKSIKINIFKMVSNKPGSNRTGDRLMHTSTNEKC